MKYYSITEFAQMVGMCVSTIRIYDEQGLLLPHHRSIKGKRFYTQDQVDAFLRGDFESPLLRGNKD